MSGKVVGIFQRNTGAIQYTELSISGKDGGDSI